MGGKKALSDVAAVKLLQGEPTTTHTHTHTWDGKLEEKCSGGGGGGGRCRKVATEIPVYYFFLCVCACVLLKETGNARSDVAGGREGGGRKDRTFSVKKEPFRFPLRNFFFPPLVVGIGVGSWIGARARAQPTPIHSILALPISGA